MITGRSKKLDQLYVSKAEFEKEKDAGYLRKLAKAHASDFNREYANTLGVKALKRLKNSAKRAKRSALGYFLDVLSK